MNTMDSDVEQRLTKAAEIIKKTTNSDQKKKAKAGLALLNAIDQVTFSNASRLLSSFESLR